MRLIAFAAPLVVGALVSTSGHAESDTPKFAFPMSCKIGVDCEVQHYVDRDPGPDILDWRCGWRTISNLNDVNIRIVDMALQRQGVDVLAAASGRVERVRDGVPDISIRASGAPSVVGRECGNGVVIDHGGGWETQYCHLAKGSISLAIGTLVKTGDVVGRVGLSGLTEFPHLGFVVRHDGKTVDPFDPIPFDNERCREDGDLASSLWTAEAQAQLSYKAGAILNAGFSGAPVSMESIEAGEITSPGTDPPVLAAYVRAIELAQGDIIELTLSGPGEAARPISLAPLDKNKAQYFAVRQLVRPRSGWPRGRYVAIFRVIRGGKPVVERRSEITF
jgi:hypothetical protein